MRRGRTWGEAPLENACDEGDRVVIELETLNGLAFFGEYNFEDIYTLRRDACKVGERLGVFVACVTRGPSVANCVKRLTATVSFNLLFIFYIYLFIVVSFS